MAASRSQAITWYLLLGFVPGITAMSYSALVPAAASLALVVAGLALTLGGWILVLRKTSRPELPRTLAGRFAGAGHALVFCFAGMAMMCASGVAFEEAEDRTRFSLDPQPLSAPVGMALGALMLGGAFMTLLGAFTAAVRLLQWR
jgi:hypothetical protein